jgi:hypothetical protein
MSYIGVQPVTRATRVRTFGALASATTTIAIPGGFSPSNIEVFIDGLYVQPTDYDDSDGFNLVFIATLALGTEYVVMEARNFEVANHYTKQEIQDASFDFNTMPTVGGDSVVLSGSNADGEYTRFADGTQQVWKTLVGFSWAATSRDEQEWTFPLPFVGTLIIAHTNVATFNPQYFNASATAITTTKTAVSVGGSQTATGEVNVSAIGRWK